jgi:hypothetical protein
MAQKKHTPEEIIGKLREAEIVQARGGAGRGGYKRTNGFIGADILIWP